VRKKLWTAEKEILIEYNIPTGGRKMIAIKSDIDFPIPMRDGLRLSANIYRPEKLGKYPVIMAFTGFSKDAFWSEKYYGWQVAYEPCSPTLTASITFEANDPAFWVPHEYALIIVDPRGYGRSPGQLRTAEIDGAVGEHALIYQALWARDMYDAIEWAGTQEWSNGNVGLSGVSILGFSQWRVAGLNPPHLKAINPWEAMTDFHRDVMFPGGTHETKFSSPGGRIRQSMSEHNPAWPPPDKEDPPAPVEKTEDEFLADITVPTLICGTWGDHGTHTRGSFRAFRKISSKDKWLYTHGRQKWAEFYAAEARTYRKLFFDHFLKGTDDRILGIPRVRLEVRETIDKYTVRWEDDFPIQRTDYTKLYLDTTDHSLKFENTEESKISYDSANGKVGFDFTFDQDTELTGYMSFKLWVCPDEADDMDIFVTLRKLDRNGDEVYFDSWAAPQRYPVAFGWLRLSHKELDPDKSTLWEPYPKYVVGAGEKVKPGEAVACEIPILPSSTLFRKGETLRLEVSGLYRGGESVEGAYGFTDSVNKGTHSIYAGGKYDSHLLTPIMPPR
jgi:predicted acyl esterase